MFAFKALSSMLHIIAIDTTICEVKGGDMFTMSSMILGLGGVGNSYEPKAHFRGTSPQ